jgi:hypothetical protein
MHQHLALICPLPLVRDGWQMADYGASVVVPPRPRHSRKQPSVATSQISYSCSVPPPRAPLVVAPSDRCPCVVHPKPEICISCSGLVIVCCSSVAGRDHVASCSSRPHTEVVKSVKTKPPEVVSLVLPLLQVVCGRHCQKALLAAQGLGGIFFPNFKSRCKSSRKLKWFPLLPVR